jgi:hypothetical protein
MARATITDATLMDHVLRQGDAHPPIRLESADRTIIDPAALRARFGHVIEYLTRVEQEVDRNVLELLTLLPEPSEVDRLFYADVWSGQEMAHGYLLEQLQLDLGMAPSEPYMTIPLRMKLLGALAHFEPIQDIARMLYYLTGASTERQAVLAYSTMMRELDRMGERAVLDTIIHPIKQQEPGHFAFYQMSATKMIQDGELAPWQLFLVQQMRKSAFTLVGVDYVKKYQRDMGGVIIGLGIDAEMEIYAREIGRLEERLVWANRHGLNFPPYFLEALRDSVDLYRGQGSFDRPAA